MNWAGNVWTGSDRWIEVEQLWAQLKSSLAQNQYIEVRYETLIKEPESTLTDLCDFIGIPYSPNMFDYVQTTDYDLPNPKLLGQWQHNYPTVKFAY